MDIETKQASLDTLSVTIQALHVDKKQMTLAVFRQLPKAQEDEGCALWGTVRYSIKDEGDVWLVFSFQGKLYRRAILPLRHPRKNSDWSTNLKNNLQQKQEKLLRYQKAYPEEDKRDSWTRKMMIALATECQELEERIPKIEKREAEDYQNAVADYLHNVEVSKLTQLFIAV